MEDKTVDDPKSQVKLIYCIKGIFRAFEDF